MTMIEDAISAPVGTGQPNNRDDVRRVQHLLNRNPTGAGGERYLVEDGIFGPKTQAQLESYQREVVRLRHPDGIVEPHGPTLRALSVRNETLGSHGHAARTSEAPAPHGAEGVQAEVARHPVQHHESASASAWVARALPAARAVKERWGVPVSVTLAQGALESQWGTAHPGNEFFGIKGKAPDGRSVRLATHEETSGRLHRETDGFRAYGSLEQSADDYGHFLSTNKRYAAAFDHKDDAHRFIHEVAKAHYASDSNYEHKVGAIIDHHDLTRFDHKQTQPLTETEISKALWANTARTALPGAGSTQEVARAPWLGQAGLPHGTEQAAATAQSWAQTPRLRL